MANRIVRGIGWTTASSVVRNLVQLLQLAILTRFLDKADFGIVAIAHLFVGFTAMFLDMGISIGIIHRQNITNKEYSSLFWLNIIFGVVLTFGLFFLAPILTLGYHSEDLKIVVQLLCLTIFLNALGTQQRTFCQKKTYFGRLAIIEIIGAIITLVVAVATAMMGYGVYSLAYSTLAGALLMNVTHLVIGLIKDSRLHFHFSLTDTFPFLKIGIYQVGSSILDFLTRELDILIISATLGLEFLGVYNIAKRVPTAIYSFIQPIVHRVFAPLLAERQSDKYVLKTSYMRLSKALSWISFPMYLLLAAISPTVISVVFGTSYLDGVPVMMVFCLRYAFNGINGVCGTLQTATGRTDIGLIWTIYLIVSTAVVYYTTSMLGMVAFLIGICVLTLISVYAIWYIQFRPMVDVKLSEYLTIYTRSFIISLLLSIIVYAVYSNPSIVYSIYAGAIFTMLFLFAILKTADGREILEVMKMMKVPSKAIVIVERIVG
jgi:teichuronic acid exporter